MMMALRAMVTSRYQDRRNSGIAGQHTMSDYEQLHRQCRTLENLFDSKLTSYSQLVATITRPTQDIEATGSSERWNDLQTELDELLEKVALHPHIITMP